MILTGRKNVRHQRYLRDTAKDGYLEAPREFGYTVHLPRRV
jgi:hypothetical protein